MQMEKYLIAIPDGLLHKHTGSPNTPNQNIILKLAKSVVTLLHGMAVCLIRSDGSKRSPHMSVEDLQTVYIAGVDPAKSAEEQ